jgi:hypothetical protein
LLLRWGVKISITAAAVVVLMTGCLAAPAPGEDGEPDGFDDSDGAGDGSESGDEGDPAPPGIVPTCETRLDMAFVSRISAPSGGGSYTSVSYDGLALFVNVGDERLDLSSAEERVRDVSVEQAGASIMLDPPLDLPAGEAHGFLAAGLDDLVLSQVEVEEIWSSSEEPHIQVVLGHAWAETYRVQLEVRVGALLFVMPITIEIDEDSADGAWTPLESSRVAGSCAARLLD